MKFKLLLLLLIYSLPILADEEVRDSVKVKEVEIVSSRKIHFSDGYRTENFTGSLEDRSSYRSLADVLMRSSSLNVKSYGSSGASASISFRGLSASQTQVNWNGFPINSITLGSADVSNVLITPQSTVNVVPGAGGVAYGSGTFGGAVNIDYNTSDVNNNVGIDLTAASFGTYKVGAFYNTVKGNLRLSGNLWSDQSDSDFDYYDEIKDAELKRHNANYNQKGFQQYFSYKSSAYSELKGGLWAMVKDVNIPGIEGASLSAYENQKDSTFRSFLEYKKVFQRSSLVLKGAWFYADQHYIKKDSADAVVASIDSRIKSDIWFADINYRHYVMDHLSVDIGSSYNHTSGRVDAYNQNRYDQVFALIVGARYVNRFSSNVSFRKDWATSVDSDLLFNAGISYPCMDDNLIIRGAFSQKFRRPSFNDLYWEPGGNEDLKPESGYSIEGGLNYKFDLDKLGSLISDVSIYYSPVNNMIVWRPDGAIWSVKNYSDVLTKGFDLKLNHVLTVNSASLKTNASFAYNNASIRKIKEGDTSEEGHPLYYAPQWISNINSEITTSRQYSFFVNWQFVSERHYDNSDETIDPYWLFDAKVSKKIEMDRHLLFIQMGIENILDKRYQTVKSFPMPGRLWELKLKYTFN